MDTQKHPTLGNGKICYIGIPSNDVAKSAEFYKNVFGWHIGVNTEGEVSFDDSVREVSGIWQTGRQPSIADGFVIAIMVDSISSTLKLVILNGGQKLQSGDKTPAHIAKIFDLSGNMIILFEH